MQGEPVPPAVTNRLVAAGLRPTRQRMMLAGLLFSQEPRHITAEGLHREAKEAGAEVSLATVYNTLHQFTAARLLSQVSIEGGCAYFDTNTDPHHHFLCEESGALIDIPAEEVSLSRLPRTPEGREVSGVDVVIRLRAAR